MKKNLFLLLIFTVLFFEKVFAQGRPEFIIIAASDVNIREEPTTTGKVLTRLQLGQIAKILKKSDEPEIVSADQSVPANYWYKISFNGQSGWVYGAFAFELEKATDMRAPWAYDDKEYNNAPNWYIKGDSRVSIYSAVSGVSEFRGYRTSFFVLINGSEVNSYSKAILLEGDSTTEKYSNPRYRNMISYDGGRFEDIVAGFDENEKIVILLRSGDICLICDKLIIWEGTYQPSKNSYIFTLKYGTQTFSNKRS